MANNPNRNKENSFSNSDDKQENENRDTYADEEWDFDSEEEEDDGGSSANRRKWIRNTILFLLVAALVGNILAFWPRIYNMKTLPLLFESKELSSQAEILRYKEAVVTVSTDNGKGTGFHINDGYIVTNYHVIENNGYIIVRFPEQSQSYKAKLSASNPDLDIAILKADIGDQQLPFIEIERDKQWEAGEPIYVIGNPLYFTQIAIEGAIIGLVPIRGRQTPVMALQAPVYSGNSGSPVINEHGKAIAVVYATADIQHQDQIIEAGLAVPITDMESLLRTSLPPEAK
ncbi:S1 family peptidase [Cohnella thailandensis]|uniref:Trypsin-like peptidase domain-containing protein n=1 Tax=Cohnella thailandensis TaxID=557557 RepID=A0A841SWJ3_9BACL|nr:serine protease [Cohnella thailandensis]MBB6633101.1 trypsin-like peptidase domain-containing protein [Cohnella thailandensis]MBP1975204.1 S1-C subfamily serine protease [Cohnella thailandensis]